MTVPQNDDELMERMAKAISAIDPVPDDVIAGAKAAFIARNLDQELAELLYDSATDRELVLTRGDTMRTLSFASGEIGVELEVNETTGAILGQLVPAQVANVELEVDGLVVESTTTDELGRFRFTDDRKGSITIVCRGTDNVTVCTIRFER